MSVKVATWNVNSIRVRKELVSSWVQKRGIDILCMQEIKTEENLFPFETFKKIKTPATLTVEKLTTELPSAQKYLLKA